jgi:hypothetical protein
MNEFDRLSFFEGMIAGGLIVLILLWEKLK